VARVLKIRTVFFDFGGTLLVMRRDRIISRILSDEGYQATPKQVNSAYFRVEPSWLRVYGDRAMSEEETEEAYRQLDAMIFRLMFPNRKEEETQRVSGLMRRRWTVVEKSVPLELYPDAVPTLERLKSEGYKLGLVSNAPPDTLKAIDALGLPRYLPTIVVSGIVGFSKPNPEIFRIALRRAESEANETVHVGDLYEADVLGARNAGIKGVLIDRYGVGDGLECPKITGLGEVYSHLE
jgi:HAD superfamily hydrolase (TIGR01549 family)